VVSWDVDRWLPVDNRLRPDYNVTALDGHRCWRLVFRSKLFIKFVTAILTKPGDIIESRLRLSPSSVSLYADWRLTLCIEVYTCWSVVTCA